jgi:uncharacterized protein
VLPPSGSRARPTVTWGLGDFALAWVVGLLAGVVAIGLVVSGAGDELTAGESAVLLVAQDSATIGWLVLVAHRKGMGSLGADFGFTRRPPDGWGSLIGWVFAGVGLQVVVLLPLYLLQEVHGDDATQGVVDAINRGSGAGKFALAAGALLLAPVTEELLYRGVLLRSLLRRCSPGLAVLISAAVFAGVHLADPSIGTVIALPALLLVGLVCGYQAVRTGNLWRPVALHVGFNALAVVNLVAVAG